MIIERVSANETFTYNIKFHWNIYHFFVVNYFLRKSTKDLLIDFASEVSLEINLKNLIQLQFYIICVQILNKR